MAMEYEGIRAEVFLVMKSQLILQARGATDKGLVRHRNQDAFIVDPSHGIFVVADGMGGHAGGEVASSVCTQEVAQSLTQFRSEVLAQPLVHHPHQPHFKVLANAVNQASTKIYERALEDPTLKGMGTTATVMLVLDQFAYCAHVGDSRLYLLRCGFIYQMTSDHSLVNEQVQAGLLTEEEAKIHQLRNVITRSVGYQEEEYVDTLGFALADEDLILICSDGLHGKVSNRELSLVAKRQDIDAVDELIDLANERGGDDNITVVIVKVGLKGA